MLFFIVDVATNLFSLASLTKEKHLLMSKQMLFVIGPLEDFTASRAIVWEKDEREKKLREVLGQDRVQVKTRAPGDWHARDLVLLRILQIYYGDQVEHVDIDVLLQHHSLIDRYEKFVLDFDLRNEVNWPELPSFPV